MEKSQFSLVEHFKDIKDPRMERRKLHNLIDIVVIAICAIVGGANNYEEIEIFAKSHRIWFKKFLDLPNGIPSHDTFERVFSRLNPEEFRTAFANWTKWISGVFTDVIAIDGQTYRGARSSSQMKSPIHMISAWASGLRLVLAQRKTDEKSNEITAIPEVLKLLELKGCIVTIDAMGCQQQIAQQIVDQSGNYILGLKGNQGLTREAVESYFRGISENKCNKFEEADKGHGRIETRQYLVVSTRLIPDLKEWPDLNSAIKVISTRDVQNKVTIEERFYISSLNPEAVAQIGGAIRAHWGIENSLHYVLDVTFGQDASRIRKGNGAENFGVLRHFAMNILRGAPYAKKSSPSNNLKRMRAGMDTEYLEIIMKGAGLVTSAL